MEHHVLVDFDWHLTFHQVSPYIYIEYILELKCYNFVYKQIVLAKPN